MRKRRRLWFVFGVCAAAVVTAMAWLTSDLLALERAQAESGATAEHDGKVRLALWRMDSWLSTAVALETRRRPSGSDIAHGAEWPEKTPLVQTYVRIGQGATFEDDLAAFRDYAVLRARIDRGLARMGGAVQRAPGPAADARPGRTDNEFGQRNFANNVVQSGGLSADIVPADAHGSILVPMWVRQGDRDLLAYLGHQFRGISAFGFLADDAYVRRSLLALVADLLPDAKLRALTDDEIERDTSGLVLASAPIALDAPRPAAPALPLATPSRITLAIAWLAILASLAAVGVTLKRTVDLSERRSRFASSVTHELRTPLTTFRLYSEMLADGMLADAAQRQVYLDTLKTESARLATLVENVLAYARVEEGRLPLTRGRIAVADLLRRAAPPLERRAKDAGMTLAVDAGDAAAAVVHVDPDIVAQVLFNLVDNAAKYAAASPEREVALNASVRNGAVRIAVRDHGPGIRAEDVRAAFAPFERAGRPPGDAVPGIGLGLALSRALARDLGGDLDYEQAAGGGARFVLTLPI